MKWISSCIPVSPHFSSKDRIRSYLGVLIGIGFTAGFTQLTEGNNNSLPLLLAPICSSAVLLFVVPGSPLAQPWSLLGGNLTSAAVGVACVQLIESPVGAVAAAIPLAMAAMFCLRCIHPPSGAVALTAILGGPSVHGLGYGFLWMPVGASSLVLLAIALLYHKVTGRRYPYQFAKVQPPQMTQVLVPPAVDKEELDKVSPQGDRSPDVEVDDLREILGGTETRVYHRHMKNLFCADIMTKHPRWVQQNTPADMAVTISQKYGLKALPVVDENMTIVGIVTRADFVSHTKSSLLSEWLDDPAEKDGKEHLPVLVRDMMSKSVKTIQLTQPISDLVSMFAIYGHRYFPVVDFENRLQGMVTQDNLVAGLHRESLTPTASVT